MAAGIPWEIRLTLRAGSVYYFQEHGLTSAEPHYFVVVVPKKLLAAIQTAVRTSPLVEEDTKSLLD